MSHFKYSGMLIKDMIAEYNRSGLPEGWEKMTQRKLALAIMVDEDIKPDSKVLRMNKWATGKSYTGLTPGYILDICDKLACSPNELLGYVDPIAF